MSQPYGSGVGIASPSCFCQGVMATRLTINISLVNVVVSSIFWCSLRALFIPFRLSCSVN